MARASMPITMVKKCWERDIPGGGLRVGVAPLMATGPSIAVTGFGGVELGVTSGRSVPVLVAIGRRDGALRYGSWLLGLR